MARARALPLFLLAAATSLATWGQVLLFADQPEWGTGLYVLAIFCALLLGVWCPFTRFTGGQKIANILIR